MSILEGLGHWSGRYDNSIKQWPVGHGGFFTQNVCFRHYDWRAVKDKHYAGELSVIVDCGSGRGRRPHGSLSTAIDEYVASWSPARIDLLVITHFDQDHINGLPQLSEALRRKGISVSRIWAPLLTPIERLVTAASTIGASRQLAVNPEGALADLFAESEITL